ncbi:MAG: hypothetical protein NTZ18_00035 [Candidatus Komeilibacteria bacterium]|nr:hypothetical protein [Candidatus Komeilibacteria bacterium]
MKNQSPKVMFLGAVIVLMTIFSIMTWDQQKPLSDAFVIAGDLLVLVLGWFWVRK